MKNLVNINSKSALFKKQKRKRAIIITLIALFIISAIGVSFAANANDITGNAAEIVADLPLVHDDDKNKEEAIKNKKLEEEKAEMAVIQRGGFPDVINEADMQKQIDASIETAINRVSLSDGFESNISKRNDSAGTIKNAKKIIADKMLNSEQQIKLEALISANADATAVCSLYDFMFDNYFTEDDMDKAIKRYNGGEDLARILDTYASVDESYVAHNYPEGLLEYLIDEKGASIDGLYAAEIISHRGLIELSSVLERLSNNDAMEDICEELGVINTGCIKFSVTIIQAKQKPVRNLVVFRSGRPTTVYLAEMGLIWK